MEMQQFVDAVMPKGEAARNLVAEMRRRIYVKNGVLFERHKDGTVEALGPFYRIFKEIVGGVRIIE